MKVKWDLKGGVLVDRTGGFRSEMSHGALYRCWGTRWGRGDKVCKADESPHQNLALLAPWSGTSSLQNCVKINISCLSLSVYDILLWLPKLTGTYYKGKTNTWSATRGNEVQASENPLLQKWSNLAFSDLCKLTKWPATIQGGFIQEKRLNLGKDSEPCGHSTAMPSSIPTSDQKPPPRVATTLTSNSKC